MSRQLVQLQKAGSEKSMIYPVDLPPMELWLPLMDLVGDVLTLRRTGCLLNCPHTTTTLANGN